MLEDADGDELSLIEELLLTDGVSENDITEDTEPVEDPE